ncbi:MAG TPA: LysR family transcriptional regulator [Terriglobales bacterium]|nr:LysR family transcriptional regulator [Terriglobales bacterium]
MAAYTLKQLRYFVAAAEAGSVTGAGQVLHVSQPSISAAIAQLEERFGVALFIRHHAQGLSLTTAGRRLLADAKGLLEHAEDLRQAAIGLGKEVAGDLHVGCFQTFAPMVMPQLLREFSTAFPDITVHLHENHVQGVHDELRKGATELALTYDLNLGNDIDFTPLSEVPLHAFMAEGHPLASRKKVSLHDLVAYPMILLSLPQSRDYFLSILYSQRLQPRIAYETPSFEMMRGLVANSDGFSLMHSRPVSDLSLDGRRLIYRPLAENLRTTQLGIARLTESRPTRKAAAFIEFCQTHFATNTTKGQRVAKPG